MVEKRNSAMAVVGVEPEVVVAELEKNYIDFHMLSIRYVDFAGIEREVVMRIENSSRFHMTAADVEELNSATGNVEVCWAHPAYSSKQRKTQNWVLMGVAEEAGV